MSNEPRDPLTPAEDRWLDQMLDAAAPVEPTAAVRRAVAEIPLRHPHAAGSRGFGWPEYAMRFALLGALAAVAVGAWLGAQSDVLPEVALTEDVPVDVDDDAWEELALLAFSDDLDEELVP